MNPSEHDLEFILQLSRILPNLLVIRNRTLQMIGYLKLDDYGFDTQKASAKEIGEHDEYPDRAASEFPKVKKNTENSEEEWFDDEEYWDE